MTRLPHASIGSDLIVGFPGRVCRRISPRPRALLHDLPLTHLHVFPYSDRPGTDAARLAGELTVQSSAIAGAAFATSVTRWQPGFAESQQGTIRRALTVDDGWSAVTDNYLKVSWIVGTRETSGCRSRSTEQQRHLLSGRLLRPAFHNQLTACGPDISTSALSH